MKLSESIAQEYSNLKEHTQSKIVSNPENVHILLDRFLDWFQKSRNRLFTSEFTRDKKNLEETLSKIEYSSSDIFTLCFAMREITDTYNFEKSGFFLTALISAHYAKTKQEEAYTIITEELPRIDHLFDNFQGGNVTVFGSIGNFCCLDMKEGNIHILGSTGSYCGVDMAGGSILISENTTDFLGKGISGGEIIVEKNVGRFAGKQMQRGYICIKGNAEHNMGELNGGGIIVVYGNTKSHAGDHMRKGVIVIKGDCDDAVGRKMDGGIIIVEGNAGKNAGEEACFGKIYLDGTYDSIGERILQTKIYVKGKKLEIKK